MKIIWNEARKKCNITDGSFEQIVELSDTVLSQDDKDFILTSFNAGMYNYVVEYVFNKTTKILQDAVFTVGEEVVVNIVHWIDKSFISKFFDVFILRLACDFNLITRQEKVKILEMMELLQKRKDKLSNDEIDKERAKYLIINCFDAVLSKDYKPFVTSIQETIEALYTVEVLPYSDIYNDIVEATNKYKNLLMRMILSLLRNTKEEGKRLKTLCQNAKNILPYLLENKSANDDKFIAYYLKLSGPDSVIGKVFSEMSTQVKIPEFNYDINLITKLLKSCQDVLSGHYSINSHRSEVASLIRLREVDHYPNLFLRSVITPCVVTYLGNNNGYFVESREVAEDILSKMTPDKWTFYFKNYFQKDDFVLHNLMTVKATLKDWCTLVKKSGVQESEIKNENIVELIRCSKKQDFDKIVEYANKIFYS